MFGEWRIQKNERMLPSFPIGRLNKVENEIEEILAHPPSPGGNIYDVQIKGTDGNFYGDDNFQYIPQSGSTYIFGDANGNVSITTPGGNPGNTGETSTLTITSTIDENYLTPFQVLAPNLSPGYNMAWGFGVNPLNGYDGISFVFHYDGDMSLANNVGLGFYQAPNTVQWNADSSGFMASQQITWDSTGDLTINGQGLFPLTVNATDSGVGMKLTTTSGTEQMWFGGIYNDARPGNDQIGFKITDTSGDPITSFDYWSASGRSLFYQYAAGAMFVVADNGWVTLGAAHSNDFQNSLVIVDQAINNQVYIQGGDLCSGSGGSPDGNWKIATAGSFTGTSFITSGGTSSQFLKANGSVDSSTYLPYTSKGSTTLVSGTKAITISGLTTSNQAFVQLTAPGGTLGNGYKAVCTTNTLTITAVSSSGSTVTTDISTLNYLVI